MGRGGSANLLIGQFSRKLHENKELSVLRRAAGRSVATPRSDNVEILFCIAVALVETNSRPMGVTLVNTQMSHKLGDPGDLVELAKTVQKVKEDKCIDKIRGWFLFK